MGMVVGLGRGSGMGLLRGIDGDDCGVELR